MTIELIKATGTCQMTPNDSFALRDVSESGRSVGEKVMFFSILFSLAIFLFQQKKIFSVDGILKCRNRSSQRYYAIIGYHMVSEECLGS